MTESDMTERHKILYLMLGLGIGIVIANWGGWAVIAFFIGLVVGWNLSWSTEHDMEVDEKERKRRTAWINLGMGVIFGLLLGSHHERPE